jgi:hypothetical protein
MRESNFGSRFLPAAQPKGMTPLTHWLYDEIRGAILSGKLKRLGSPSHEAACAHSGESCNSSHTLKGALQRSILCANAFSMVNKGVPKRSCGPSFVGWKPKLSYSRIARCRKGVVLKNSRLQPF